MDVKHTTTFSDTLEYQQATGSWRCGLPQNLGPFCPLGHGHQQWSWTHYCHQTPATWPTIAAGTLTAAGFPTDTAAVLAMVLAPRPWDGSGLKEPFSLDPGWGNRWVWHPRYRLMETKTCESIFLNCLYNMLKFIGFLWAEIFFAQCR